MKKFCSFFFSLFFLFSCVLPGVTGAALAEGETPFTVNVNVSFDPTTNLGQNVVVSQIAPATAIFQRCLPSVVKIDSASGGGTGFFISEDIIITNQHVVEGAQWLNITNSNGEVFSASRIIAYSNEPDLAMVEVPGANGTPVEFADGELLTGEQVYTIGNPMGIFPCLLDGIVVKADYEERDTQFFLANLNVIGGNSGGPVFNGQGKVVGVVVATMGDEHNSFDMVIKKEHVHAMEPVREITLRTKEEVTAEMNRPDEEKYERVDLDEARVGTLVSFGRYEQDNDFGNGQEEILWLVMEEQEDRLVLMSLYCLDGMPYSLDGSDAGWETSSVRDFLNGEFYNSAFSAEEQTRILDTTVVTPENPVYHNFCSADTVDKVYLMDHYEVMRYFDISEAVETVYEQTRAQATEYAMTKELWLENPETTHCWMWLRSNGSSSSNAGEIGSYGYLSFNGGWVGQTRALRPLIQIQRTEP